MQICNEVNINNCLDNVNELNKVLLKEKEIDNEIKSKIK